MPKNCALRVLFRHPGGQALALLTLFLASGCFPTGGTGASGEPAAPSDSLTAFGPIKGAALDSGRPVPIDGPIVVAACRNETVGLVVRLDSGQVATGSKLRLVAPARGEASISLDAATVGQVRSIAVDLNRAGYVRQAGLEVGGPSSLPRAIVPLPMKGNTVTLDACRPTPELGGTLLWIDLPIAEATAPGDYAGAVEIIDASGRVVGREPIRATVYDLVLPVTRNLRVMGEVTWDELAEHFRDDFEAVTPKLLNRTDKRYARAVRTLDSLVKVAQAHRLSLSVDRLQPTAKWNPPAVEWDDFDGLVGPWLDGSAFIDREPLGLWPLPIIDFLGNYPAAAQREYFEQAALHFDAKDWLSRSPVWLRNDMAGDPASGPAKRRMLERAALVLGAHPRVRVAVPLSADQLEFGDDATGASTLPRRGDDDRLLTASPGLIFNTPIIVGGPPRRAPTFLRTDLTGLVPYAGTGGDERDVRVTAWLAFTRGATIVRFDNVLPSTARSREADPNANAGDPNELVWFYPGSDFGVDGPVPSLQLKWLRRAEQDYEYLALAKARGQVTNALIIARLLTKPVQIQPAQKADPVYTLMTGTTDQRAWEEGLRLLAKTILIRKPGEAPNLTEQTALNVDTVRWVEPQEKPLVLGRTTVFSPSANGTIDARIGVDLYNARDITPAGSTLGFGAVPRGWTVDPQPIQLPPPQTYQVQRASVAGTINPDALDPRRRADLVATFTDGRARTVTPAPMVVPAAVTRRHEGGLQINGLLDDWTDDDALNFGPLVRMLDRPTLQQHTLAVAPTPSFVYSAWSEANFYVAFKVNGLAPNTAGNTSQNFVRNDFRRAWGEDVVQVLVQAVYADGSLGPVLHLACKPNGGQWSERKLDLRPGSDGAWETLESGARYACKVDAPNGTWRGELAIPWRAIHPPGYVDGPNRLPVLLRFNFTQHQHATGTSATWAGPVDHGRDDLFMGVLVLRNETR